jgi:2-isopropylmalate synthase
MAGDKIWLFDTTLRDGGQTRGVDFSRADKIAIAEALDEIGIDYIEAGWPGANPTDDAFFASPPQLDHAKLVAFGMTRRGGRSTANDPGLNAVIDAEVDAACLVGKTWDFHVKTALNITLGENLDMISQSLKSAAERGREPMFDCEHFFDGYKANPTYALDCVRAAQDGGASWVVLCDTNGGSLPDEVFGMVSEVKGQFPDLPIGIHCHNDAGVAVANSLAAIAAGARQVQGTINGLGERCGNANLITLIPSLVLKTDYETSIPESRLHKLMGLSRFLDDRLNRAPDPHAPYVGEAAFAHKGGLHASAAQKDPRTYEHVAPEKVGNERHYLVSDQAGRSNMLARFAECNIDIDPKDPRLDSLIALVKAKEFEGWAFDSAEASFELLARRMLGQVPDYFRIGRFRVMDERRFNARGELVLESEATTTIYVGDDAFHEVAIGNGPVNAVDTAMRKALNAAYPSLTEVELVDYKVRILDAAKGSGTGAITRVLIEFRVPEGALWRTVGLSTNIIDASVAALSDGMIWKLQQDHISGPKSIG